MNDDDKIRQLLKQNIRPVNQELERDLWPQMLRRLEERSATVPWFDWALAAVVVLSIIWVPSTIPMLLYHL
ncbi:MAG TPA: hypothetical protein VK763_00860 [Terriglobales bacterium]|jgi:hypothetical protein|nr:hypothetical protein [Terriglobales bacterium]